MQQQLNILSTALLDPVHGQALTALQAENSHVDITGQQMPPRSFAEGTNSNAILHIRQNVLHCGPTAASAHLQQLSRVATHEKAQCWKQALASMVCPA